MSEFGFQEMQDIQKELQEKYKERWGGLSPEKGREDVYKRQVCGSCHYHQ